AGSMKRTCGAIEKILFNATEQDDSHTIFRWRDSSIGGHGTVSILDARGAIDSAVEEVRGELKREPPGVVLFFDQDDETRRARKSEIDNLISCLDWSGGEAKIVGISFVSEKPKAVDNSADQLQERLIAALGQNERVVDIVAISPAEDCSRNVMSVLSRD